MTNEQKIRKACVKANPEIMVEIYQGPEDAPLYEAREIRLSDVLVVLNSPGYWDIVVDSSGFFRKIKDDKYIREETLARWNIYKDNLSGQTKETLSFLANLLPE